VDFDGVLHNDIHGWQGPAVIRGAPVPGAIDWLRNAIRFFNVYIYSGRSQYEGCVDLIKQWLMSHGMEEREINRMEFPVHKPVASVFIDDRAMCFRGVFPTMLELASFERWNHRPMTKRIQRHD
jgi:hypothetical protein